MLGAVTIDDESGPSVRPAPGPAAVALGGRPEEEGQTEEAALGRAGSAPRMRPAHVTHSARDHVSAVAPCSGRALSLAADSWSLSAQH